MKAINDESRPINDRAALGSKLTKVSSNSTECGPIPPGIPVVPYKSHPFTGRRAELFNWMDAGYQDGHTAGYIRGWRDCYNDLRAELTEHISAALVADHEAHQDALNKLLSRFLVSTPSYRRLCELRGEPERVAAAAQQEHATEHGLAGLRQRLGGVA